MAGRFPVFSAGAQGLTGKWQTSLTLQLELAGTTRILRFTPGFIILCGLGRTHEELLVPAMDLLELDVSNRDRRCTLPGNHC
jgi:hypothetical protein